MSLLSWFFPKTASSQMPAYPDSGSKAALTKPMSVPGAPDSLANLKQQRHEHRERLYEVIRSVMLRSEVLASHYKFKVLSLDARGRQFLVMVDLLNEEALPPDRWAPVEQLIAMTATQRHELLVKAVYWRWMMSGAKTDSASTAVSAAAVETRPPVAPVAVAATAAPAKAASTPQGFEPINPDEVMAFKKAIADAAPEDSPAPASGQVTTSGPRRPTPLPGYEDTQLMEPDDTNSPLSKTQYGGLD